MGMEGGGVILAAWECIRIFEPYLRYRGVEGGGAMQKSIIGVGEDGWDGMVGMGGCHGDLARLLFCGQEGEKP